MGGGSGDRRTLAFDFGPSPAPPADPAESRRVASPVPAEPATPPPEPASAAPAPAPPAPAPPLGDAERPYSVGDLGRALERAVAERFPRAVWIEGEAGSVRFLGAGHGYFTLKDDEACLDAVVWRSQVTPRVRQLLKDGALVRVRARPAYWAQRGRLQVVVDRVELAGLGKLHEALERLREKLRAEGLFEAARKRPLPKDPRVVGIVTSRTGAVVHDIARVAFRRGGARLLLAPPCRGGRAASVRRRRRARAVPEVDVVVVARGGGSAEELFAFNDEQLLRAVAAHPVPVVSAVGHDSDWTLLDHVADARAATPSQAAELVVADGAERDRWLAQLRRRLERAARARLDRAHLALGNLEGALAEPTRRVAPATREVDALLRRADRAATKRLERAAGARAALVGRLLPLHPKAVLGRRAAEMDGLRARLARAGRSARSGRAAELARLAGRPDALSPLRVLDRGYALATTADGHAVRRASEVAVGAALVLRVARGVLDVEVTGTREDDLPVRGAGEETP